MSSIAKAPTPWARTGRRKPHRRRNARPWAATLPMILAAIPSIPRPVLARLTQRMVDRLDEIDGDPDFEPASYHEGYSHDPRIAEHRDAAAYLAAHEDEEEDEPDEDDGTGNEEDDYAGGNPEDEGELGCAVETVDQKDWSGSTLIHGDGRRHEDEEPDDPNGRRRYCRRARNKLFPNSRKPWQRGQP